MNCLREPLEWGKRPSQDAKSSVPEKEKEKPSFEPSGKLAEDTNTYKGVVIKYNEPPEAKLPKIRWRLYPFKVFFDKKILVDQIFVIKNFTKNFL